MEYSFKVGDEVIGLRNCGDRPLKGAHGTVMAIREKGHPPIGVAWVPFVDGHSGGDLFSCKYGYGWYVFPEDIKLAKPADEKIVITHDGKTTTARMYSGKQVVSEKKAICHSEDEFVFETGAKLAFERLMAKDEVEESCEPEKEKVEPVKLYCVKSKDAFCVLTKGKIYTFVNGGISYDDGFTTTNRDKTLEGFFKRNERDNLSEYLVPLVDRKARLGEWVLAQPGSSYEEDSKIISGELYKVTGFGCLPIITNAEGKHHTIFNYLVLDGYKPSEDLPSEDLTVKADSLLCIVDYLPGEFLTKGKVYDISDGTITYDNKYSLPWTGTNRLTPGLVLGHHCVLLKDRPAKVGERVYCMETQEVFIVNSLCGDGDILFKDPHAPNFHLSFLPREAYLTLEEGLSESLEKIKLYCSSKGVGFLNVNKADICFWEKDSFIFPNGYVAKGYESLEDFCERNSGYAQANFIPLVSRPAKVGEWVYVDVSEDSRIKKGEIYKVHSITDYATYIEHPQGTCRGLLNLTGVYKNKILVLDGYKGEEDNKRLCKKISLNLNP